MKITKLIADNFMRLRAVSIEPSTGLVVISGKNGAGKSSVLSAIESALGGTKHTPEEPIRRGEKKARVILETETLIVTRTFTAKCSQLEVKSKDGGKVASPQELLNNLLGPVSFDPLLFQRMKPLEQAATLRKLVGLDFAAEDTKRQEAFDNRTDVNREVKRLQGALDKLPEPPVNTPDAESSVAELSAEIERRQKCNAANEQKRRELTAKRAEATKLTAEITEVRARLAALEQRLEAIGTEGKALRVEVDALTDEDTDELRSRIATAEQTNAAVRAKRERTKLQAELDSQTGESEKLTEYIAQIDQVKADAVAKAKMPIPGLAVTDDGVTLDGLPFSQASQAQRLRASVAIGLAIHQELKILLVRDGSLLDSDGLKLVAEMADAAGAQIFLETVGGSGECGVLIVDGAVAGNDRGNSDA